MHAEKNDKPLARTGIKAPFKARHHQVKPKELGNLITSQPEGELKKYERSGFGFTVTDGTLYTTEQSDKTYIVYAEDGTTVYIKNIVNAASNSFGESWAVGTLSADGTTITVDLEQTIGWSYTYDVGIRLAWGETVVNEDGTMVSFQRDETVTQAIYTVDNTAGTISLQGTNGRTEFQNDIQDFVAKGLTCEYEDDGAWPGYLEWNTVLTEKEIIPAPEIITEQPAGELRNYLRSGSNIYQGWDNLYTTEQSGMADIVFAEDGETVYLRDVVFDVANDVWVKGTLSEDGTKISAPIPLLGRE